MKISRKYNKKQPKKFQNVLWSSSSSINSRALSNADKLSAFNSNNSSDSKTVLSIEQRMKENNRHMRTIEPKRMSIFTNKPKRKLIRLTTMETPPQQFENSNF